VVREYRDQAQGAGIWAEQFSDIYRVEARSSFAAEGAVIPSRTILWILDLIAGMRGY
jgi:hypothetical protein